MFGKKKDASKPEQERKTDKKPQQAAFRERLKSAVKTKHFRLGTYTAATTAIVLAILVAVNLLVSALPETYTKPDLSGSGLYDLSAQTENLVGNLKQDVTVYWIVQDGYEDDTLQKTLARYEDLSKHVKVEKIDPVANPNFAYAYTTEDLYNNSLVVTSADASKSRYISYYDIYESSYDEDYNTVTSYNGEGALTAAVNFVTSDTQTKVYYLSGHGEDELPSNLVSSFENENISLTQLNLLTEENIPSDCAALLLYSPASDLSQEEIDKIEAYLAENGSLMLFTDCDAEDLPRLHAMMAKRGVEAVDGMVVEGDSSYYMSNYPNYLIPQLENHEITEPLISGNYYVLMPMTQGLKITAQTDETEQAEADETDASLSVTALLSTTADAYSKIKGLQATDAEKEDGDIAADADGFALAAEITEQTETGESKLVWVASTALISSQIDQLVSGGNTDFVTNAMGWLCEMEDSISIHAKTISYEYLTLTSAQAGRWTLVMVILIPVAVLAGGMFRLGRLHGVERPALAPLLPNGKDFFLLIDCGANVDCRPEYLHQFAQMGTAYMQTMRGVANPRVGLVNNGAEAEKGCALTKAAYEILSADEKLNFVGNVEAREITHDSADVIVCDGFVGNVILKFMEGVSGTLMGMIKREMLDDTRSKIGALLAKPAFHRVKKAMDYSEVGGAPLLGVSGNVVKAHGSCNAHAFACAIHQAEKMVTGDVVGKIEKQLVCTA